MRSTEICVEGHVKQVRSTAIFVDLIFRASQGAKHRNMMPGNRDDHIPVLRTCSFFTDLGVTNIPVLRTSWQIIDGVATTHISVLRTCYVPTHLSTNIAVLRTCYVLTHLSLHILRCFAPVTYPHTYHYTYCGASHLIVTHGISNLLFFGLC